jgi:hypothetical protein
MTQAYFVYENWTRNRGRVHKAECSICNQGNGFRETDSGRHGRWHGPYTDRGFAFKFAASLNRADMRACSRCDP